MMNRAIHLLSVLLTAISVAHAAITTYTVPSGLDAPEGVSTSPNSPYFFTAGSINGTIFRGTFDSPVLEPFIPAGTLPGFKTSFGQKLLPNGNLILAGGQSGNIYVVSTTTKTLLHTFNNGLAPDKTLVNDIAVDEETGDIFATDTTAKCVWRVKGSDIGEGRPTTGSPERWVEISGLLSAPNGIVVVPGGYVIVGDLFGACLWTVERATKEVVKVDTGLFSFVRLPGMGSELG